MRESIVSNNPQRVCGEPMPRSLPQEHPVTSPTVKDKPSDKLPMLERGGDLFAGTYAHLSVDWVK